MQHQQELTETSSGAQAERRGSRLRTNRGGPASDFSSWLPEAVLPENIDAELVDLLEEFTQRIEAGNAVDVERFAAEHPAWAKEIRRLFPTLLSLAELGLNSCERDNSPATNSSGAAETRSYGDFRIVREIGRGGMGIVYEAEQAHLGRRIALKVLTRAAALDPRALQRFRLEAQVAGWLRHPRIVSVLSVGEVDHVPYYAMQYVEGGSLADLIAEFRALLSRPTEPFPATDQHVTPSVLASELLSGRFATDRPESDLGAPKGPAASGSGTSSASTNVSIQGRSYVRTIARLGRQAAEALGYAHDQGVIHRDVKPANLLLDYHGDVWIADFGMADVQGDASLTLTGDLPGTLRYMSPEQARGQRALVDRRTDVYSLGASLYELLTLRPVVAGADRQKILRQILEEEPVPIRRVNPAVPVDLATIVTKALAKAPSSRYETAWHLAKDLQHYLEGRPIAARRVGPLARSWRWCRRRPIYAGMASALVLTIVAGFAGVTWAWREAVRQQKLLAVAQQQTARERDQKEAQRKLARAAEQDAREAASKAKAMNQFLLDNLLAKAAPSHNPVASRVTLLEVLDRAAAEVGSSFKDQPEVEADIRHTVADAYHGLGAYAKSEPHYRAAYEFLRNRKPGDEDRLRAESELGHILVHLGRWDEAEPLLENAVSEARRSLGLEHDTTLVASRNLARCYKEQGRCCDAEPLYRAVREAYQKTKGPTNANTLTAMNDLGTFLQFHKKLPEAEQIFRQCVKTSRETQGPQHPSTLEMSYNLAFVWNEQGRLDEAEPLLRQNLNAMREVMGGEHPVTLRTAGKLGSVLLAQGRLDEAEALLRPCLEAQRRTLGPTNLETTETANFLDAVAQKRAKLAAVKVEP